MSDQLGLPGIGQQKFTLDLLKTQHGVATYLGEHLPDDSDPWCAWDGQHTLHDLIESTDGFVNCSQMGFGSTEQAAVLDYCRKMKLEIPPFWTHHP